VRLAISKWQLVICLIVTLLFGAWPALAATKKPKGKKFLLQLNMGGKVKKGPWEASKKFKKGSFGHTGGRIKENTKNQDPVFNCAMENPGTVKVTVPNGQYSVMIITHEQWLDKSNQKRMFTVTIEKQTKIDLRITQGRRVKTKWLRPVIVKDGVLDIEFKKVDGNEPLVTAILVQGTAFPAGAQKDPTKTDPKKEAPKKPTVDPAKVAAAVKARAEAKQKQIDAIKARREASAKKALEAAMPLVEKHPVKAYFAFKAIVGQYRGTEASNTAAQQAEDLFSTPKTGRLIRPVIKENEAGELMKMAKSYVKLKRYEPAYNALRKLIKEYRTTKHVREATKLLEQVRVLKKKAEEDAK
jgi:hypothetical protein